MGFCWVGVGTVGVSPNKCMRYRGKRSNYLIPILLAIDKNSSLFLCDFCIWIISRLNMHLELKNGIKYRHKLLF